MDLQAKLLRAIQNREIIRVGSTHPIKLDLRFLAATNADLKKKVAEGTFRQDLYYRLNVIPIKVPPLRERIDDIDDLIQYFINYFATKHQRSFTLSENSRALMKQYSWPGNIRELENIIDFVPLVRIEMLWTFTDSQESFGINLLPENELLFLEEELETVLKAQ